MKVAVGVLARAPVPGECKRRLLAAHPPEWICGLYAAMLRDTLDGLQMLGADAYIVFAPPEDAPNREVLARHAHAPWSIELQEGEGTDARVSNAIERLLERADVAVIASSDAPSAPTEPLTRAIAELRAGDEPPVVIVGPCDDGDAYLAATTRLERRLVAGLPWRTPALVELMRVRCKDLGLLLRELPAWYAVDEPSDVLRLLDELRKHPERAPRTAQFLVTKA